MMIPLFDKLLIQKAQKVGMCAYALNLSTLSLAEGVTKV